MSTWIDMREPPESLLALAASDDCHVREHAARSLGNYAHTLSVEILVKMLDDEYWSARTDAICSLAKILKYEHLAQYKHSIGILIARHLFKEYDLSTTIRFIYNFFDNQLVLDQYLLAIQMEIDKTPVPKQDSQWLGTMLSKLSVITDDDKDYVTRKLVMMGITQPGLHHRIVRQGLTFFKEFNQSLVWEQVVLHLENGNYLIRAYGNGPKIRYENRAYIRKASAETFTQILAKNPEYFEKPSRRIVLIRGLKALIRMMQKEKPGSEYAYKKLDTISAYEALWRIFYINSVLLSVEILGKDNYYCLPKELKKRIEQSLTPTALE